MILKSKYHQNIICYFVSCQQINISSHYMQPCAVCMKLTDKCCGLCRTVFYCSQEHQQIDWHIKHKNFCIGKITSEPINSTDPRSQQFRIYSSHQPQQQSQEDQIHQILSLVQQRLIIRKKSITAYVHLQKLRSSPQAIQELINEVNNIEKISESLCEIFRPSLTKIIYQVHRITITQDSLLFDYLLDRILLARCYLLIGQRQQIRKILISISSKCKNFEATSLSKQDYSNFLQAALQVSDQCNLDRTSQIFYSKYVLLIEQTEGMWERIYAYFSFGAWYAQKTYYSNAIKCFQHSKQLLISSKNSSDQTNVLMAQIFYNQALCFYAIGRIEKAVQFMQGCLNLRIKFIGKNSLQVSDCLEYLAQWSMTMKEWQHCLQFLQQCHRIRKSSDNQQSLLRIRKMVQLAYTGLYAEKSKNDQKIQSKNTKYYTDLLSKKSNDLYELINVEQPNSPTKTFAQRIVEDDQQLIKFKVNILPEMFDTYSTSQCQKLGNLLEHTDKEVQLSEAIRILLQSEFLNSLNQTQKQQVLKLNNFSELQQ